MKKNEHYFPTMEFVKDAAENNGWKRRTFEGGAGSNGVQNLTAETMDEGGAQGGEVEVEPQL